MKLLLKAGVVALAMAMATNSYAAGVFPFPAATSSPTGNETIPADTNLGSGLNPATESLPLGLIAGYSGGGQKNALIGGDFATNLAQRPASTYAAITPSTPIMTLDRWYTYSSTNNVTITKQTGATDTIPAAGLLASMRVSRPSGTLVTPICVGQLLDTNASAKFLGNNAVLSFWALGTTALNTVANGIITPTIAYHTTADSATPFTNTSTFAQATITGYQVVTAPATGITTTWTRYSVAGFIPATNASGTAVTGVGVSFCYTPASGTGASTEWFELAGVQLEATPTSVTVPGAFERRAPALEAALQQRYATGAGLGVEVNGQFYQYGTCVASGNANFGITFPVPMRTAPTAATSTLTAGGYSIQTAAAITAIGTITLPAVSAFGVTLNSNAACTSTLPYELKGTNTTGFILFSAEP